MQEYTVRVYTSEDNSIPRTEWRQNYQLHRTDGPAVERTNGDKLWYLNDQLHRTDGPAIEWANGDKEWFVNDQRHRTDGPAREWANGYKAWFIEGKHYTGEEFKKKTRKTKQKTASACTKIVMIDGIEYELVKKN